MFYLDTDYVQIVYTSGGSHIIGTGFVLCRQVRLTVTHEDPGSEYIISYLRR